MPAGKFNAPTPSYLPSKVGTDLVNVPLVARTDTQERGITSTREFPATHPVTRELEKVSCLILAMAYKFRKTSSPSPKSGKSIMKDGIMVVKCLLNPNSGTLARYEYRGR